MRPKQCRVENFGSYKELEFNFDNLGLTLINGVTGSGKSTILDILPYALFGMTSKGGGVEDVRTWGESEPTKVTLQVELPAGDITITRIRGKASQNDLYITGSSGEDVRGKDLSDTQKILNDLLGVDGDLFNIGSFYSQFTDADKFFIAKPKDRREVLERIADVSTAVRLAEAASERRKEAKKELEEHSSKVSFNEGKLSQLQNQLAVTERASEEWEANKNKTILDLTVKSNSFEADKERKMVEIALKIEELETNIVDDVELEKNIADLTAALAKEETDKYKHQELNKTVVQLFYKVETLQKEYNRLDQLKDVCHACNRPGAAPDKHIALEKCTVDLINGKSDHVKALWAFKEHEKCFAAYRELRAELKTLDDVKRSNDKIIKAFETEVAALESANASYNIYADRILQVQKTENNHLGQIKTLKAQIDQVADNVRLKIATAEEFQHMVWTLTSLYDLSFVLRGELLKNSVAELERATNEKLQTYFDGAFRVTYLLEDSDKLEVVVSKGDYDVSYRSLSGGERKMLTLSFATSLMEAAANKAGVDFTVLCFDEPLTGLSSELKIKSFRLFEELSTKHSSVIMIDHSQEFQDLFENRFEVEISPNGYSELVLQGRTDKGSEAA